MIKKTWIGIVVFVLLIGVYIVPEQIKNVVVLSAGLLFAYCCLTWNNKIVNLKVVALWTLFILIGGFAAILSETPLDATIEFSIPVVIGVLAGNVYIERESREFIFKSLFAMTLVVLVGCIMQLVDPTTLSEITSVTLGSEKFNYFQRFLSYNALVGFSYQTGVTGFYLAVLEGLILCYFLGKKDKSFFVSLVIIASYVGIYVLILFTGKRSQLLAVVILSTGLFALYNKKHVFKIIVVSTLLFLGGVILLNNTEAGQLIITRTYGDDATSGRSFIYSILVHNFLKNPVIGNGFGYTLRTIAQFRNGHNVYLQILSENGFLGLSIYLSILFLYTKQAFECLKFFMKNNANSYVVSMCLYIEGLFVFNSFIGNPLYDVFPIILYLITTGVVSSTLNDINDVAYERLLIKKENA